MEFPPLEITATTADRPSPQERGFCTWFTGYDLGGEFAFVINPTTQTGYRNSKSDHLPVRFTGITSYVPGK